MTARRRLTYAGTVYTLRDGESVMDALLRQGVELPFSCRRGVCQVCMQRCIGGALPKPAQKGIRRDLAETGHFLPCLCRPQSDLVIAPPERDTPHSSAGPTAHDDTRDRRQSFDPDPEMWAALKDGELLTVILSDFYTRAFDDPVLAPYFAGVTKQRLIEKVYSFMRQCFTGEKLYFGDRPRNAHHWMVISDATFDHRERLLVSCMRRHGLAEHLIKRWCAIEESFRGDIVKPAARPRLIDGVAASGDGLDETILDIGTLCDGCGRAVMAGERVRYHRRLGHLYCNHCQGTSID